MKYACITIYTCLLFLLGTNVAFSQVNVSIQQQVNAAFNINEGATIVLHAGTSNAVAYQWYKDGVPIAGAVQKDYTTGASGVYTVVAFNAEGCSSKPSSGVQVTVNTPADTLVDLAIAIGSLNKKAMVGESFQYQVTVNNNSSLVAHQVLVRFPMPQRIDFASVNQLMVPGTAYEANTRTLIWKTPTLKGGGSINMNVTVKVTQVGTVQSTVYVSGQEKDPILANNVATETQQVNGLIIPTVFTPNGDGVNDTFVIPGLSAYAENDISIINRWGNTLYQKKNYMSDWTGDGLPDGTYFYVLKAKKLSGEWENYKGYITLLRSRM